MLFQESINSKKLIDALSSSVNFTFQKMTYLEMIGFEVLPSIRHINNYEIVANIEIMDPFQGAIGIVINSHLIHEIGKITYNTTPDIETTNNILGEFSNTIAGKFVGKLVKPMTDFHFSLPRYSTITEENKILRTNEEKLIMEFYCDKGNVSIYFIKFNTVKQGVKV